MSTYRELYMEGRNRLQVAGIANAEGDARALLLYASGMSLNQLLLSYEDEVSGVHEDECHSHESARGMSVSVTESSGTGAEIFSRDDGNEGLHQGIIERYLDMIDRRCAHVPLQYITHVQNFCGYDMYVDEHVLIPRQDTEILVEKVLDKCGRREPESREDSGISGGSRQGYSVSDQKDELTLLDLCTGSGCIAIVLKLMGDFGEVYASDISPEALQIARRNAQANGAQITFIESDMFDAIESVATKAVFHGSKVTGIVTSTSELEESEGMWDSYHETAGNRVSFDVIVSNPPYIPSAQVDELDEEVRNHEPRLALAGEADGLYFYRKIAREAGDYLKDGGRLFLEIGCDQGETVSRLLEDAKAGKAHYENIEITKDLAGLDRVVSAIWRRTDA